MGLRPRSETLHAIVNVSAAGQNTQIIAGNVGQRTTIYRMILTAPGGANTVTIFDNSNSPVALSAPLGLPANGFLVLYDANNGDPWWQTTTGVANAGTGGTVPNGGININLQNATQVTADIYYTQEVVV